MGAGDAPADPALKREVDAFAFAYRAYFPEFFFPPAAGELSDFESELRRLRDVDDQLVRLEFAIPLIGLRGGEEVPRDPAALEAPGRPAGALPHQEPRRGIIGLRLRRLGPWRWRPCWSRSGGYGRGQLSGDQVTQAAPSRDQVGHPRATPPMANAGHSQAPGAKLLRPKTPDFRGKVRETCIYYGSGEHNRTA